MAAASCMASGPPIGHAQFLKTSAFPVSGSLFSAFLPTFPSTTSRGSFLLNGKRRVGGLSIRAETLNRKLPKEYGGQWLSSTTRHVRIYAGYIDPVTQAFDQTQLDKLTLILDPEDEFLWPEDKCKKVYDYFSELVDHYEGAPLTEYTLRLIGSDVEHYIRKLLLAGEIKYNLNCKVLNFSMGKPRLSMEQVREMEESAADNKK